MFGVRTLTRHAALANEMAEKTGADLPRAMAEGRLTGEGVREAVLRCTYCERVEACESWLARHPDGAEAAPGYCRNAALFAALTPAERPTP